MSAQKGFYVLENRTGNVVRTFQWENPSLTLIFNHQSRRVEAHNSVAELEKQEIKFDILAEVTKSEVEKSAVNLGGAGTLRWRSEPRAFAPEYEMSAEDSESIKKTLKWSAGLQVGLLLFVIFLSWIFKPSNPSEPQTVTVIPKEVVEKMINQETLPAPQPVQKVANPQPIAEKEPTPQKEVVRTTPPKNKHVVVEMSQHKLKKLASNVHATGKHSRTGVKPALSSPHFANASTKLNEMGALKALGGVATTRNGHGGQGGLNLNAVASSPGSGAGGHGYGGFGNNGGGGKGLGGLGKGSGQGLTSAMYGKGLVAAPFGDGSPAPGRGGYGTRGKAGGGEAGAGYGSMTMVGSSKGYAQRGWAGGSKDGHGAGMGTVEAGDDGASVEGGLDKDQIEDVIMRHMGQITYCYEQGLQVKPQLSGTVSVKWIINESGRVQVANIGHTSLRSNQVESCMVSKIATWKFPQPTGHVSVRVSYPFVLRRVSQN